MAKHPTPKRKLPKSDGRKRYASFQAKARKRLQNMVNLVEVQLPDGTTEVAMNHCVSPSGYYKGKKVLKTREDKRAQKKPQTIKA